MDSGEILKNLETCLTGLADFILQQISWVSLEQLQKVVNILIEVLIEGNIYEASAVAKISEGKSYNQST